MARKQGRLLLVGLMVLLGMGFTSGASGCEEKPGKTTPRSVAKAPQPPELSDMAVRRQLRQAMVERSQWDRAAAGDVPVYYAVTDLDADGQVEVLVNGFRNRDLGGYEVRKDGKGLEYWSRSRVEQAVVRLGGSRRPAWFMMDKEHRAGWVNRPPAHAISMLLDSYEIFIGRKKAFG